MKIVLFGATGMIGSRILKEAVSRKHEVTAVVREGGSPPEQNPLVHAVTGDIMNPSDVARLAAGQDLVISAYGPGPANSALLLDAVRSLIEGLKGKGVPLIAVGGAGSLEVAPGLQLADSSYLPPEWKDIAIAHRDALNLFRSSHDLTWTSVSPSAMIEPGARTGHFRIGTDSLISDAQGNSRISAEDFAVAILNEAEAPKFRNARFTAGY